MFENAGLALFESMTDTSRLNNRVVEKVSATGFDLENLFYRWLEELLNLYYTRNLMCREVFVDEIIIKKSNGELEYRVDGGCRGEEFNPEKHEARVEIKAAGRVNGTIESSELIIESKGIFEGKSVVKDASPTTISEKLQIKKS